MPHADAAAAIAARRRDDDAAIIERVIFRSGHRVGVQFLGFHRALDFQDNTA